MSPHSWDGAPPATSVLLVHAALGAEKEAEADNTAEPEGPDSPSRGAPSSPDARHNACGPQTGDRVAPREGARPRELQERGWSSRSGSGRKKLTQQQADAMLQPDAPPVARTASHVLAEHQDVLDHRALDPASTDPQGSLPNGHPVSQVLDATKPQK